MAKPRSPSKVARPRAAPARAPAAKAPRPAAAGKPTTTTAPRARAIATAPAPRAKAAAAAPTSRTKAAPRTRAATTAPAPRTKAATTAPGPRTKAATTAPAPRALASAPAPGPRTKATTTAPRPDASAPRIKATAIAPRTKATAPRAKAAATAPRAKAATTAPRADASAPRTKVPATAPRTRPATAPPAPLGKAAPAAPRAKGTTMVPRATTPTRPARGRPTTSVPVHTRGQAGATPPPTVLTAAQRAGGRIVQLLDHDDPIAALRHYLAGIAGVATIQEGQIALGAAQLMLMPIEREQRGGADVLRLLDAVLARWEAFPERAGFHAQGFLRNAFAAVGDDPARLAHLAALVPEEPSPELAYNIAAAYAYVGDKGRMLEAVRAALAAGASPDHIRRDTDFVAFVDDPDLVALLDDTPWPVIPVEIEPYVPHVRAALRALSATLRAVGEHATLHPPASVERILAAERAGHLQLPNDYRALLTLTDGLSLWESVFHGTTELRTGARLPAFARTFAEARDATRADALAACVPLARWGEPLEWLAYDPYGGLRGGVPGYVLVGPASEEPVEDLPTALAHLEAVALEVFGTN